ncbi:MAG: hypothetical protein ACK5QC_09845 [Bacteroidota bacterium]|jgi:hypothetical protein
MTRVFKPKKIGFNDHGKQLHEKNLNAFRTHLSDFFNEIDKHVTIESKTLYKANPLNTFLDEFNKQHRAKFPEMLSLEKCLELAEIRTDKIRFLSLKLIELNNQLEVNWDTLEFKEPDFNIYSNNLTQNQLFDLLNNLVSNIEEAKQYKNPVFMGDILRAFGGMLVFDHSTQKLKPNIGFILSK